MIKAVVLDVGGVLHSFTNHIIEQDICAYFGLPTGSYSLGQDPVVRLLGSGEISEAEYWVRFQKSHGLEMAMPEESLLVARFGDAFEVNKEVLDWALSLPKVGLRIAVLSNTIAPHAAYLRRTGIYEGFEVVVLSHEVGFRKPDQRIYEITLSRLQLTPDEVVFIDDDASNVKAAQDLGMYGLLYEGLAGVRQEIAGLCKFPEV